MYQDMKVNLSQNVDGLIFVKSFIILIAEY